MPLHSTFDDWQLDGATQVMRINGNPLSRKDERVILESESEFKRRGRFELIFPSAHSNIYRSYFEEMRPLNHLLHKRCLEKGTFNQMRQQSIQRNDPDI
jgi:hypothetical protein